MINCTKLECLLEYARKACQGLTL